MKIFTVIFCLLLSVDAWGQNNDTIRKDTSKISIALDSLILQKNKPLIVIDGIIYKDDIKNIEPNTILSIDFLKNPGATNIYGPIAANGAILMMTKKHHHLDPADSTVDKNALFVIDGQPSKNKLNDINPSDILSINILKKGKGPDPSLQFVNDVVIVVTKANAKKQYQKKFSAFSKDYKKYLDDHQGSDEGCGYQLDDTFIYGESNEDIRKLYEISDKKIKKVKFLKNPFYKGEGNKKMLLLITTKK